MSPFSPDPLGKVPVCPVPSVPETDFPLTQLNNPKPIETPLAFLLFVCGLLTIYIYIFFFQDTHTESLDGGQPQGHPPVPQDLNVALEEEVEGLVSAEENPSNRRFASSLPPNPSLPQGKLVVPEESESGTIEPVAPVQPLQFFGVEPGVGEGSLPVEEDGAVVLPKDGAVNDTGGDNLLKVLPAEVGVTFSTHFYNMPVSGNRILFLIDGSSPWRGINGRGVLGLEKELQRVVDSLRPETSFNIWVFNGERMAWCYDQFLPATSGNKAYSMIWATGYFETMPEDFREENKPDGYPGMYSSRSGLPWSSPLFLAVEKKPSSLFLVTKGWFRPDPGTTEIMPNSNWPPESEARWQAALAETKEWINEENDRRAQEGLPPRPIFNIKQVVSRRHPNVKVPPSTPLLQEDKIYDELEERLQLQGDLKHCPIHVVIHPDEVSQGTVDKGKFQKLVSPYKGGVYLTK